jgi:hypothetical protein
MHDSTIDLRHRCESAPRDDVRLKAVRHHRPGGSHVPRRTTVENADSEYGPKQLAGATRKSDVSSQRGVWWCARKGPDQNPEGKASCIQRRFPNGC